MQQVNEKAKRLLKGLVTEKNYPFPIEHELRIIPEKDSAIVNIKLVVDQAVYVRLMLDLYISQAREPVGYVESKILTAWKEEIVPFLEKCREVNLSSNLNSYLLDPSGDVRLYTTIIAKRRREREGRV